MLSPQMWFSIWLGSAQFNYKGWSKDVYQKFVLCIFNKSQRMKKKTMGDIQVPMGPENSGSRKEFAYL